MTKKRPSVSEPDKIRLWASAAGRCTFCNRLVLENEDLGEIVGIGELAHAVGWTGTSPRGSSDLTETERAAASNLVLLCRNCHKPADAKGVVGRYTVEVLLQLKHEHEERIRFLTDIGADRQAHVIRVVGPIRGAQPELSYESVLEATTAAGLFPTTLEGAYRPEIELDLRQQPEDDTPNGFERSAKQIDAVMAKVHDGVRRGDITRLAVFGFARIPSLIHLGAQLDDKVETLIFQRQRTDNGNPWRWSTTPGPAPAFSIKRTEGTASGVTLVLNLSGVVPISDFPDSLLTQTHYTIAPAAPSAPDPTLIDSPGALASVEAVMRQFLAGVERDHAELDTINVLAAAPVSAAITLGRVLMPNVSPSLTVYDRDENGRFFKAQEVRR